MKRMILIGALMAPTIAMAAVDAGGGGAAQGTLTLQQALSTLDPDRDADWTANGEPAMARIEELTGNPGLKRPDVRAAMPDGFSRESVKAVQVKEGEDNVATAVGTTTLANWGADGQATLDGDSGSVVQGTAGTADAPVMTAAAIVARDILERDAFDGRSFDAIVLMEAFVATAQEDRYQRNSALQNLVRGYQVSQAQIKEVQARLDQRIADRAEKNRKAREATAAELAAAADQVG